ncbi:MAG: hypothetical protein NTY08_08640 [Proteobacteria bacterium]|nr:hypothetical protein [Pseudomonadota bacterium]
MTLANGDKQTIEKTLGVTQTALISPIVKSVQELYAHEQATSQDVAALKAEIDRLKALAGKSEAATASLKADSQAKDAAIAQLKAESARLKAALCSKFSDLPFCASNLVE